MPTRGIRELFYMIQVPVPDAEGTCHRAPCSSVPPEMKLIACCHGHEIQFLTRRAPLKTRDWCFTVDDDMLLHGRVLTKRQIGNVEYSCGGDTTQTFCPGVSRTSGQAGSRRQTPGLS